MELRIKYGLICLILVLGMPAWAQVSNDICAFATHISNSNGYCSGETEFTNVNAQADTPITNNCFLNYTSSVWFSFTPTKPSVIIRVNTGSLSQPEIGIYEGTCNNLNLVGCTSGGDVATVQLTATNLVIGQLYYIHVDGSAVGQGTFQLCIDDFISPPAPEGDCPDGVILCDKSPFFVENLAGFGQIDEIGADVCINEESASVWYKWTCKDPGTLTFTLTPNNYTPGQESDDLDFAIFRMDSGINDCSNMSLVRCMASGANGTNNVTDPFPTWQVCNGPTGLMQGDNDLVEVGGCQSGDNNFVRELNMQVGESYALIINNFSQSGLGFSIEFGGTATFLGPEVDFAIDAVEAFECDKTIQFTNLSNSETDEIVSYQWNFGNGADPVFSDQEGPHDIIYDSFGDKIVALTIRSSRGCEVTKILELEIDACCADTTSLEATANSTDLVCFGIADGTIIGEGMGGFPPYQYSIDGINFQPNPFFGNLNIGEYNLLVQDRKGCLVIDPTTIDQPEQIIVNAGQDSTINFGDGIDLNASYTPVKINDELLWSPDDSITCLNCLDPYVVPLGNTTYTLTVTDEFGCTGSDQVTIRVNIERPVHAPNVFSPNQDGLNDFFNLWSSQAASGIDNLYIYDRWGNLIYRGQNIQLNNLQEGWDGTFKGEPVNPGVFTWMAEVRFIDDMVFNYSGDITVLR